MYLRMHYYCELYKLNHLNAEESRDRTFHWKKKRFQKCCSLCFFLSSIILNWAKQTNSGMNIAAHFDFKKYVSCICFLLLLVLFFEQNTPYYESITIMHQIKQGVVFCLFNIKKRPKKKRMNTAIAHVPQNYFVSFTCSHFHFHKCLSCFFLAVKHLMASCVQTGEMTSQQLSFLLWKNSIMLI